MARSPVLPRGFLGVSEGGRLLLDGVDAVELAEEYGTPLFVFSESQLRQNYRRFKASLGAAYPRSRIMYACKANPLLAILRVMRQEGAGIDVVSEGEQFLAHVAGFEPDDIVFNGNSKSPYEIALALSAGITMNVDSLDELSAIRNACRELKREARVCLRVIPDVHSGTIDEFATGISQSKFGLDIATGEAWQAVLECQASGGIQLVGLHCHIGSQIESMEPYERSIESVASFAARIQKEIGIRLKEINLGGGFAIPIGGDPDIPRIEQFAAVVGGTFRQCVQRWDLGEPLLLIEPGGSLVGDAGVVLLRVNAVKVRANGARWVMADGGADVLLRATQEWYTFPIVDASKPVAQPDIEANIAGPLCYSGDVIGRRVALPDVRAGSILAVLDAGAYTLALCNHYNARLSPAALMVKDGQAYLVSRRGQPSDLITHYSLPAHLYTLNPVPRGVMG